MTVSEDDIVIAGGGLAAVRTAQSLRDLHHLGRITLLSDEAALPYDRPPLSKGYLLGKVGDEQIRLLAAQKLADMQIEVRVSCRAVGLDRELSQVRLADGSSVDYGRLVVATGARPVRLAQFDNFSNVHVLRTMDDAKNLREALRPGQRVGIVGAGFIGLEIAAAAIELGCQVTVIEAAAVPLAAILGAELGACIQRWHERKGVVFRCGAKINAVHGDDRVRSLSLTQSVSNGEVLEVDAVVVGVGQQANVEWLADSGLALHRGLVCDVNGRTLDSRVFGVGDAVCTQIGEAYHPTRQWTAVTEQARRTAAALCGHPEPGIAIEDFYFWSDQHGSRLQFAGQVPDDPRWIWVNGGPNEDRFVALACTAKQVCAVFSLASPRDFLIHSMPLRRGERIAAPAP